MRKIKVIAICCSIFLSITGCGKKDDNKSDGVEQTQVSETTTEEKQDTTPPVISCEADVIGCIIGQQNDYGSIVSAKDDIDGDVTVEVDDSKVDYENVGEYSISFSATDSAGNTSTVNKPCYVVKNSTAKEVSDYVDDIISNHSIYKCDISSGDDLRPSLKDNTVKPFMSNDKSDRRVFEIYSDTDDILKNYTDDSYAGTLAFVAPAVVVTNTNLGMMNLDTPWMTEFAIDAFMWTMNGSYVSDFDTVVFSSGDKEIVLSEDHIYGFGYSHAVDNYWGIESYQRWFCFKNNDELAEFEALLDESDISVEIRLKDKVIEDFSFTEAIADYYKETIDLYKELTNGDIIANVYKKEGGETIIYPCDTNVDIGNDSNNEKVLPGETVTVNLEDKNIIIMDNSYATVRIKKIYQEGYEIGLVFNVTNNGDRDLLVNFDDPYIGNAGVDEIMKDGNDGPKPGKTRDYAYYLEYQDYSSLDSVLDLLKLEGEIRINIYSEDESYLVDEIVEAFSISDYPAVEEAIKEKVEY